MLDINLFLTDRGGDPELIRASQRKRGASVELVDEIIGDYRGWLDTVNTEVNAIQKQIGSLMKEKQDAAELLATKAGLQTRAKELAATVGAKELAFKAKLVTVGNIVHESVPVSLTEDDNPTLKKWNPSGEEPAKKDCLSHHDVLLRIGGYDPMRGVKALINYALNFLRDRDYIALQTPQMMNQDVMAKTAQLSEFDESLYKVLDGPDIKYLIATSEQPISAFHSGEWFEQPAQQLPIRYAGYSSCHRREAGAHGRDAWGIFRVHTFEKVEQFLITEPHKSYEAFETMLQTSESFYQSLKLPYRLVSIVSGALNNAAAKKIDLEAWFPFQGEYKELVSCSNCTDYQARRLEIRCGIKKMNEREKKYVHCLNGTLCATERTLCCILENYQTTEGVVVPEVLRPYLGGVEFVPFV